MAYPSSTTSRIITNTVTLEEPASSVITRKTSTNSEGNIETIYTQNNTTIINHHHHHTQFVTYQQEIKEPFWTQEMTDILTIGCTVFLAIIGSAVSGAIETEGRQKSPKK